MINIDELKQNNLFELYYQFLVSENEKYNLTNITEYDDVYVKHFADSLELSRIVELDNQSLCDIGSGAGFPSIPLKIMYPNLKVTIIEPTTKRVNFLKMLVERLGLKDVNIINGRAEVEIVNYREAFDIVTARAVANLPMLLELCVPYVKVGGQFITYKGASYIEEVAASKNAEECLKIHASDCVVYSLDNDMGQRALISYKKTISTPKRYPRKYSDIKKKPL